MSSPTSYTITEAEGKRVERVRSLRALEPDFGLSELLEMLTEPSWVVRRAVVEALAALGEPALAPLCERLQGQRDNEARIAAMVDALVASSGPTERYLVPLAEHADPAIVADVGQILGRRRHPASTPLLAHLTQHENDNVAVVAIEALGRIGGRAAIEALIESVESGSFFRIFPAIDVLGRCGDPRVVEPLTKLLANPNYRPEAARALGRSGERAAVKPLAELLNSRSDAVVRIAAVSLWDLRDRFEEKSVGGALVIEALLAGLFRSEASPEAVRRLTCVLTGADVPEAVAVCNLLGVIGSPEAAPFLSTKLDGSPVIAACAANALKRIGREADTHLMLAIRAGDSARRKILLPIVTRALAADDVALCLGDADAEVRTLACEALARLANTTVLPQIFNLLADTNLRVVHAATSALQTLGTRETRNLATEAAKSPLPGVRRSALNILAYFGDASATQPLLNGLQDEDARVREAAIQGLPYLEDPRALEALFDAAKNPSERTRALAMRAFGQVPKTTQRMQSLLLKGLGDADAWVRYYACQSIGRLSYAAAAPEVSRLLQDDAGQVRVSAVEALSHLNSREAHEALRRAAKSEDIDVRRAALVGLGIAHRMDDLPIILNAAGGSDAPTRLLALSALGSFPSPLILGALGLAGSDDDEQVRSAAIGFLAARPEQEASEVLVNLLASDRTRERAKIALSVPSAGRVSGLLVALESADDELAPTLVSLLSRLERTASKNALLSAMKLNNVAARKAAATALGAHLTPEITAALREAAERDPSPEVRQICTLLLSD